MQEDVAGLPSANPVDELEARMFDSMALRLQISLVDGMAGLFESLRASVVGIASKLEEKTAVPAVKVQLAYLQAIQENSFWEGIHLDHIAIGKLRQNAALTSSDLEELETMLVIPTRRPFRAVGRGGGVQRERGNSMHVRCPFWAQ